MDIDRKHLLPDEVFILDQPRQYALLDSSANQFRRLLQRLAELRAENERLRSLIDDYLHYVEQTAGCVAEKGMAGHFGTSELIERLREQLRKETK